VTETDVILAVGSRHARHCMSLLEPDRLVHKRDCTLDSADVGPHGCLDPGRGAWNRSPLGRPNSPEAPIAW